LGLRVLGLLRAFDENTFLHPRRKSGNPHYSPIYWLAEDLGFKPMRVTSPRVHHLLPVIS
jgi:hypothetical protein